MEEEFHRFGEGCSLKGKKSGLLFLDKISVFFFGFVSDSTSFNVGSGIVQ